MYDGGDIKRRQEVARRQGELQSAQNRVNIYNVRKRVNEMYFSLLLVDEQIKLNEDLQHVLEGNEKKLASMLKGGMAAESDYQNVRAERLTVLQQLTSLKSQRTALVRMLSTFCGIEMREAVKPAIPEQTEPFVNNRPELLAIDAQLRLADSQEKALEAAVRHVVAVRAPPE